MNMKNHVILFIYLGLTKQQYIAAWLDLSMYIILYSSNEVMKKYECIKSQKKTNLSNMANLGDTICCGPWMAASSQYSLTCRSKIMKMLTIFNDNYFSNGEKLFL